MFLHPSSFNFGEGEFKCPWLVYHEKAETGGGGPPSSGGPPFLGSKVYLRDCSMVTPYALLLFGGPLTVNHLTGVCETALQHCCMMFW